MREAALRAMAFAEGFDKETFLKDQRTQQAVSMSLMMVRVAGSRSRRATMRPAASAAL